MLEIGAIVWGVQDVMRAVEFCNTHSKLHGKLWGLLTLVKINCGRMIGKPDANVI